jgi:hypothetical protein
MNSHNILDGGRIDSCHPKDFDQYGNPAGREKQLVSTPMAVFCSIKIVADGTLSTLISSIIMSHELT